MKGACLSVCGSRKSSEREDRSLIFMQKLMVIFGSAVLNIIEVRFRRRGRVTFASVNISVD